MSRFTSKETDDAKRVLRGAYYSQVGHEAAELVRGYFDGEYDDDDGQREQINQICDDAVTYTTDQWDILYSSERTSDGVDMARDAGMLEQGPGRGDAQVDEDRIRSAWAYFTYESDVQETLQNQYGAAVKLLTEPMEEGLDSDERLVWLAEHFGELLLEDRGLQHYYVGVVDKGMPGEVDLGLVTLKADGTATRRSVPSKFDELVGEDRTQGTMVVLRDALLEAGFFSER